MPLPLPFRTLPVPSFFNPRGVGDLRFVDYPMIDSEAQKWAKQHKLTASATDQLKINVVPVDAQATFGMNGGGLVVEGALDATVRACEWGYRYLHIISKWVPTMDTHMVWQVFFSCFFIDEQGNNVPYNTMISNDDLRSGKWRINPEAAAILWPDKPNAFSYLRDYVDHYTKTLETKAPGRTDQYMLTEWLYHAILGGMEHALIPILHELIFFHERARRSQRNTRIKGGNPQTENYSPFQPEVLVDQHGKAIGQKDAALVQLIKDSDVLVAFGFASSHCFRAFGENLLNEIMAVDPTLAKKVYFMRDCTAPVIIRDGQGKIIPGLDFTPQAEAAFRRFADHGIHIVESTTPMEDWPDMRTIFHNGGIL